MSQQEMMRARRALDEKIARATARLAALPRAPVPDGACPTCGGLGEVPARGGWAPCPDCVCPVCGNLGYVRLDLPVGHPEFGKLRPCPANCAAIEQLQERRRGALRQSAALPPAYRELTFATFDALPAGLREGKQIAREFTELWAQEIERGGWVEMQGDVRNIIALSGAHGMGKTGLAAGALNALIAAGQPCLYIRLQDLIKAVQRRYGQAPAGGFEDEFGRADAEDVIEAAQTAPALIIDEFGVPDMSANKAAIVEQIVRYRHGRELPMLLTTNLTSRAFAREWGPTIASVVLARAHWIPVAGVNLRPAAAVWGDEP